MKDIVTANLRRHIVSVALSQADIFTVSDIIAFLHKKGAETKAATVREVLLMLRKRGYLIEDPPLKSGLKGRPAVRFKNVFSLEPGQIAEVKAL